MFIDNHKMAEHTGHILIVRVEAGTLELVCTNCGEIFSEEPEPEEQVNISAPECPKCGGLMVQRMGPRGPFWGCPNYPECRGSRNIDGSTGYRKARPIYDGGSRIFDNEYEFGEP
jgi:hypothetical protein